MSDEVAHVRGWFLKAESDFATAKHMLNTGGPYDTACFHAQQAVEKYLKGFLALNAQPFPFTHNLEKLQQLGESAVPAWPLKGLDLAELTVFAVQTRYDFEF
ncbi:MAG: HEPN domain-containing protein [Terriglobales bacterium]|jgi:HEPN domain-containing protein